mgnify:CR=1 FL=1|tara:strand:+ start:3577 stop:5148 length:1572 start_codon:yes stop_codon:yes gene_type:complete
MTPHFEYADWPIERSEMVAISDLLLERAPALFSSVYKSDEFSSRCLVNLSCRLLQDILAFVVAIALKQRSIENGSRDSIFSSPIFSRVIDGKGSIWDLATIKMLQTGLKDVSASRKFGRILKELVIQDNLMRRPLAMTDLNRDIVSVSYQPLILKASTLIQERVNLVPPHGWFPAVEKSTVETISKNEDFNRIKSAIATLAVECMQSLMLDVQKNEINVLKQFTQEALSFVGSYVLQLDSQSGKLPNYLWSGSSGIIWIRLLQDAVLRKGGQVTGFDHAEGADIDESCKFGFVELQTVSKFITFNRYTANHFRKAANLYNFTGLTPEIKFLAFNDIKVTKASIQNRKISRVQTILFLPPFISETDFGLYPALGPVQGMKFISKVLSFTAELGIDVIMKPHPEMKFPLKNFALEMPHVNLVYAGKSEDYLDGADALLLDYPMQTTMGAALQTNLPIALIDTGQICLSEKLCAAMSKRIGYAKLLEDGDGGWHFEKDHIRSTLDAALLVAADTSFAHEFMQEHQG